MGSGHVHSLFELTRNHAARANQITWRLSCDFLEFNPQGFFPLPGIILLGIVSTLHGELHVLFDPINAVTLCLLYHKVIYVGYALCCIIQ